MPEATRKALKDLPQPPKLEYTLPEEARHASIGFVAEGEDRGEVAYPMNWTELYNLKGRLLTLVDASFQDRQQRKAQKDLVWHILQAWMGDVTAAEVHETVYDENSPV